MKDIKKIISILTFILIVIIFKTTDLKSIETYTSRGRSIGDGYVAFSCGSESLVYNPALATLTDNTEFLLEYENLLPSIAKDISLNRHFLGVVVPLSTSKERYLLGGNIAQFQSEIYKEYSYNLLVAKDITSLLVKEKEKQKDIKISAGLRLKYIGISYPISQLVEEDPIFNSGREKSAFSFDIGLSYVLKDIYYYGLVVNDILQPDLGIKEASPLQRRILLGFAYRHELSEKEIEFIPSVGLRSYFNRTDFGLGVETLIKKAYSIRATYSSWNLAFGLGYNYKNTLKVDYSYVILSELDTFGGHYISLRYTFPKNTKAEKQNVSVQTIEKETLNKKDETTTPTKENKPTTSTPKTLPSKGTKK